MTTWASQEHKGEPYATVRVKGVLPVDLNLFYAASAEDLTLTLNEKVIHRALERRAARRAAKTEGKQAAPPHGARWEGQQVSLRISREGLSLFQAFAGFGIGTSYRNQLRRLSHSNIAILNEWKRMFPELDPVEVHEKFWQRRLYCPGGGTFVWNDQLMTMESTVYGSAAAPKSGGPDLPKSLQQFSDGEFGLTFEEHGLRARLVLEREK